MDQLRVHKARTMWPVYHELNVMPVFNVGYSPQFNPIEAVFSKVKAIFCRERLHNLVNKLGFNMDRTIRRALDAITRDHCRACIRKSSHLLERAS